MVYEILQFVTLLKKKLLVSLNSVCGLITQYQLNHNSNNALFKLFTGWTLSRV